jgi:uncharacterized protein
VGGAVGVVSGLLGIGGGVLMVPFMYALMAAAGWSGLHVLTEHQAALAHATSLAVILPTALSGVLAHRRHGAAEWSVIVPLGLGAAGGALVGARSAVAVPSLALKTLFGVFLLVMAWRLGVGRGAITREEAAGGQGIRWAGGVAGGGVVGFFSALLGVGGGIVAIPILIRWARMDLHRVTAASLGIITFAALAGIMGYWVLGRGVAGLPSATLGYVHLPLVLAMLPGAILLAPVGARLNNRLPVAVLRRLFALLFVVLGIRLVWIHGGELLAGGLS